MLNHSVPILVVSTHLGHSKPSITLDDYGHLIPSNQEKATEVMDEVITPIKLADIAPERFGDINFNQKNPPYIDKNLEK